MFAAPFQDEFARDRDHRRGGQQKNAVGAQQETKRNAGDQRAARVEGRAGDKSIAEKLSDENGAKQDYDFTSADIEAEPAEAVDQEGSEDGDLVIARIVGPKASERESRKFGRHRRLHEIAIRTWLDKTEAVLKGPRSAAERTG